MKLKYVVGMIAAGSGVCVSLIVRGVGIVVAVVVLARGGGVGTIGRMP